MATTKTIKKPVVKKAVVKKAVEVKKEVVAPVSTKKTVTFSHPNLKISPRKLRLLANHIKTMEPSVILTELKFTNSNAARQMYTVLRNAINTAVKNNQLSESSLRFEAIRVDEGQKIKRMDKSHGSRFARGIIMRRHSRLTIILSGTITG